MTADLKNTFEPTEEGEISVHSATDLNNGEPVVLVETTGPVTALSLDEARQVAAALLECINAQTESSPGSAPAGTSLH